MSDILRKQQISQILYQITEALDIPETRYKEAEERYQAVGNWLSKEDSPLHPFNPIIYTQGSFRLGTVVKPVSEDDNYDIDLVCLLEIPKNAITQQVLKKIVGDRLKANKTYAGMLDDEGRRCWTLNYAESAKFHMDILPAIPDEYGWLIQLGVPAGLAKSAVCLTDKDRWLIDPDWPRSNPRGYAEWFKARMKVVFKAQRMLLAEKLRASIEEVPEYKVKTPLQRAVQILKRHRDIVFEKDPDDKPISIIITTLAARSYNNETDLYEALSSIITGMPGHVENKKGVSWVPNPVNPKENFADKWREHPQREANLKKWLQHLWQDLTLAMRRNSFQDIAEAFKPIFGERTVNEAFNRFSEENTCTSKSGQLIKLSGRLLSVLNAPHRQAPLWIVQKSGSVSIKARASRDGFRSFYFNSNSEPLPKHFSLLFEAKTTVPSPFEVFWQVVNTGVEAKQASDLRGGFINSGIFRKETTRYRGSHWIECFVVKNGICVAQSGEFIVNIQ